MRLQLPEWPYDPKDQPIPDPASWAYRCRNVPGKFDEQGQPIPFDHTAKAYQYEPLVAIGHQFMPWTKEGEQWVKSVAMLKGRQVGGTQTLVVTPGTWGIDMLGLKVAHAVPSEKNALRVNSELRPCFEPNNLDLANAVAGKPWGLSERSFVWKHGRHVGQMRGSYFLGHTNSVDDPGGQFASLSSVGIVCFDEFGTMHPQAITRVRMIQRQAPKKVAIYLGSAKNSGDQLDNAFLSGSRAEWNVRCTECGEYSVLAPYGSTVEIVQGCIAKDEAGRWYYVCQAEGDCQGELDVTDGYWDHERLDTDGRLSYHIAAMNDVSYTAADLAHDLADSNIDDAELLREICGQPYGGSGLAIGRDDIQRKTNPSKIHPYNTSLGIDWGARSNWVAIVKDGNRCAVVDIGEVDGPEGFHPAKIHDTAIARYQPKRIGADWGGNNQRNQQLNTLSGRVWEVHSKRQPAPGGLYGNVRRDARLRSYHIAKSWIWERIIDDIQSGTLYLGSSPKLERLADDILAVRPMIRGRKGSEWIAYDTSRQHYASALIYAYTVHLMDGGSKTTRGKGNHVRTPTRRGSWFG